MPFFFKKRAMPIKKKRERKEHLREVGFVLKLNCNTRKAWSVLRKNGASRGRHLWLSLGCEISEGQCGDPLPPSVSSPLCPHRGPCWAPHSCLTASACEHRMRLPPSAPAVLRTGALLLPEDHCLASQKSSALKCSFGIPV